MPIVEWWKYIGNPGTTYPNPIFLWSQRKSERVTNNNNSRVYYFHYVTKMCLALDRVQPHIPTIVMSKQLNLFPVLFTAFLGILKTDFVVQKIKNWFRKDFKKMPINLAFIYKRTAKCYMYVRTIAM